MIDQLPETLSESPARCVNYIVASFRLANVTAPNVTAPNGSAKALSDGCFLF